MSTQRSSVWSLTLNNPTPADEENIALARQRGWKVDGQLEKGENGTPHYQLILKTPQVRFSAVKKAFPRAHIEVARNVQALEQYVKKDETRVSALAQSSEKYPSLSKFWILVYREIESRNWLDWSEDPCCRWWKEAFDDLDYPRFNYDRRVPVDVQQDFAQVVFEYVLGKLIEQGYHVDSFASPPNISLFKKFHFSILHRSRMEFIAQTDRQTDTRSDGDDNSVGSEHTHAVDEEVSFQEDSQEVASIQVPTHPSSPPHP